MNNYQDILTKAGLSETQAVIYEVLLKYGAQPARLVQVRSPFKRGLVYKALERLEALDLVQKTEDPGKVAVFSAKHPLKIKELAENEHRRAETGLVAIDSIIGQLSSDFNLMTGKPGVRFFEGMDGIRQVWWDSLSSKTTIYTYGDLEVVAKNFAEMNKKYLNERQKRGLKKLAITNDSPFNRQFLGGYDQDLTETRLINDPTVNFSSTIVQIYDGRISYSTLTEDALIGVIIEDAHIYEMNRRLFEWQWRQLAPAKPKPPVLPDSPKPPTPPTRDFA